MERQWVVDLCSWKKRIGVMALDTCGHNPSCPEHCPGQPGTSGTSEITPNTEFTVFPVPLGMIAGIKGSVSSL